MLQKGFLRNKNLWHISKFRFWYSAFLGLLIAFFVYSFFCGFRVIYRLMDELSFSNGPYIISEDARYWQNFTFAVFSLALGNAIFLGSIFKKFPRQSLKNYKRLSILNDQAFLPFGGFHFIAKLLVLLSFITWGFFDLKLYKTPVFLFVLLSIVIFLESWKSIVLHFKTRVYKYQIINFVVLTLLAFCISTTSIFNYKEIDNVLQKNNVFVNIPVSDYINNQQYYPFLVMKMYLENEKLTYEIQGNKVYNLDDFQKTINEKSFNRYLYYDYHRFRFNILADSDLTMKSIKELEQTLFVSQIQNIVYVTQYHKPKYTSRLEFNGLKKGLMFFNIEMDSIHGKPMPSLPKLQLEKEDTILNIFIGDKITFNNSEIKKEELYTFFKSKINRTNIFNFKYSEDLPFQKFITVYSEYSKAVDELREEIQNVPYDENNYSLHYQEKYERELNRIKAFYPKKYLENYIHHNNIGY